MAYLAYYREEAIRWKCMARGFTHQEALSAVKRLARHFKMHTPTVKFKGRSTSYGGFYGITLSPKAGWRTLAHEMAHALDNNKRLWNRGIRKHGKHHRRAMDRISRYIVKMGWMDGALVEGAAWRENAKRTAPVRVMSPRLLKMDARRKQIEGLERKVRYYSTLLKARRRSLAGLERAERRAAGK